MISARASVAKAEAQVDEIAVVTLSLDRASRVVSFKAGAEAWRQAA
jgi:hypothetical protein